MLRLRTLSAALLVALLLTAFDPFQDESALPDAATESPAGTPVAAGQDPARRTARGAHTPARGMALLGERYVGGADVPRLLAAGQRGAWAAVAQSGIPPPDVD